MIYLLIALVVLIVGALAITRWALDFVAEREFAAKAEAKKLAERKRDYVNDVLTGQHGPTGIPGGFSDPLAERRYTALVHTADALEHVARKHIDEGLLALARSKAGRARAMRDAAARLHAGEEPIEASDSFLDETFETREHQLDEKVLEARELTRKLEGNR